MCPSSSIQATKEPMQMQSQYVHSHRHPHMVKYEGLVHHCQFFFFSFCCVLVRKNNSRHFS